MPGGVMVARCSLEAEIEVQILAGQHKSKKMSDKKEINKPPINIDKWLITKTHLKKVISLLEKRFPENTSNIDIEIKINDETDHPKSFGELDTIVNEEIIENKKILNALTIR